MGDDITFIGVAGKADLEDHQAFIETFQVGDFIHVADDGEVWQRFGARSQPAFAFIDDDGAIDTHVGALGATELTSRLEALAAT